jgi:agmatinase
MAYSGISTFMGLPLALTPDDLKADKVEVAIVGAPVDTSFGHRGAQYGPRYIRADERTVPHTPAMLQNPDTRIKPFEALTVVDYGDAGVDPLDLKASRDEIRSVVIEIAAAGRFQSCLAATIPFCGRTRPPSPKFTRRARLA